jgi:hypothetical protein
MHPEATAIEMIRMRTTIALLIAGLLLGCTESSNLITAAQRYRNYESEWIKHSPERSWIYPKGIIIYSLLKYTNLRIKASRCNDNVGCFEYELLHLNMHDVRIINAAARSLTSLDLVKSIDMTPAGSYLVQYSPSGIEALYNNLHEIGRRSLSDKQIQSKYDADLKEWLRPHLELTRTMLSKPALLRQVAEEYKQKALNDRDFNGTAESFEISKRFGCRYPVPDLTTGTVSEVDESSRCDERWVGMIVRRYIDGSLPVVLNIMNDFLLKYDSEEYSKGTLVLSDISSQ